MRKRALSLSMAVVATGALLAVKVEASARSVPSGSSPTIQAAISDASCTEILVGGGTYTESEVIARDLSLRGAASALTLIQGQVQVEAGTVAIEALSIQTETGLFTDALRVSSGADVSGVGLVVINGGAESLVLFADGFESGDLSGWL